MEALKMEDRVDRWNDDRLDELSRRMDEGFKKVDERFENVATRESVAEINTRLDRFEGRMDERMDRLYLAFVALVLMLGGNLIAGHV
jgi:hypothetical protein